MQGLGSDLQGDPICADGNSDVFSFQALTLVHTGNTNGKLIIVKPVCTQKKTIIWKLGTTVTQQYIKPQRTTYHKESTSYSVLALLQYWTKVGGAS